MLHVNEDNDELFKKAAEHYPLNTGNPDWNEVLKKMDEVNNTPAQKRLTRKSRNYRIFILILLLIPLSIFENRIVKLTLPASHENKSAPESNTVTVAEDVPLQPVPLLLVKRPNNGRPNNGGHNNGESANTIKTTKSKTGTAQVAAVNNSRKHNPSSAATGIASLLVRRHNNGRHNNGEHNNGGELLLAKRLNNGGNNDGNNGEDALVPLKNEVTILPVTEDASKTNEPLPAKKDSLAKTTPTEKVPDAKTAVANKPSKKKNPGAKHFYIGLLGGPDITAVKLQSVKRVGFNLGLIAGYRLTKKISIESGLYWIQKFYTSDGKYFNTKNITMPADATINSLNGECHMLEVPVNLSYTFSSGQHSSWFAATGVSAYLMKTEAYDYNVSYYGNTYPYSKKYSSPSTNLFAVINVSAGYTHKLGRIGSLRIEPYIKIPVKKIGTGSLPLQSTGINIGLTKDIF